VTPWPADLQPTDPPIHDDGVIELAWWALWLQATDRVPWKSEALQKHTARMLPWWKGPRPTLDEIGGLLQAWCKDNAPLTGLRILYPTRQPPRLRDDEIHRFLEGMLQHTEEGRRIAGQMLFRAGMEPVAAALALNDFSTRSGVLPTGQWFSSDGLTEAAPRSDAPGYRLTNGAFILWSVLMELMDQANAGQRLRAVKQVRVETGCGLREAFHLIQDLQGGRLAPNGMSGTIAPLQIDRPAQGSTARRRLDACIESLLRDLPMHWVILAMAEIREDATLPTMAVGVTERGQLILFFSPDFVRRISREQCKGVLQHEINHVLLGHLQVPDGTENLTAWQCACECSANEFISFSLPGNPITLKVMDLPPMESTAARYEVLKDRPGLPERSCGGMLTWRLVADPKNHTDHTGGKPMQPIHLLMEAAELVGREIDRATLETIKQSGLSSIEQLCIHLDPEGMGSMKWDAVLRGRAATLHRRIASRRFPSRRFPDQVGIIPGRRRKRERPVVLAAVDTSGSMSPEELSQITLELRSLARSRLRVAVVQCDTEIQEVRWLEADFSTLTVKGRGGTDLRPPFSPRMMRQLKPGLIVYFTDGCGPAPTTPPPGVDVLWVLTGASPTIPARYGKVVCMRDRLLRDKVKPPS
jgi:predicted metal-dependent peptidase